MRVFGAIAMTLACVSIARAQVNTGSDGSDGALSVPYIAPGTNMVIDMSDHPNGIYQYTDVNIPPTATVFFIPNANNTPVIWLVQSNCVIAGTVDVSGQSATDGSGPAGGPGGYRGGNGGTVPCAGQGPGGGLGASFWPGYSASYGAVGRTLDTDTANTNRLGSVYGNQYLLPLIGGSGGGGATNSAGSYYYGGGGGGGAILIAASGEIQLTGSITANGGSSPSANLIGYGGAVSPGGGGSGGAVRLVASSIIGSGAIDVSGGRSGTSGAGGSGRVRLDSPNLNFGGTINGVATEGFQPIIIPAAGQGVQLAIKSIAGVVVPASPTGVVQFPDVVVSAEQSNPIPIVVHCSNIPTNTTITVTVRPVNGPVVSAIGSSSGTQASSDATIYVNVPRGGGVVYATAVTTN